MSLVILSCKTLTKITCLVTWMFSFSLAILSTLAGKNLL